MKVTKQYLEQVIKEELELMAESGELEEGVGTFLKSLGGSAAGTVGSGLGKAAGAVGSGLKKAGSAVGGAAKRAAGAVGGAASDVAKGVGGAVTKAQTASLQADINSKVASVLKDIQGLLARAEELSATDPELVKRLKAVEASLTRKLRDRKPEKAPKEPAENPQMVLPFKKAAE